MSEFGYTLVQHSGYGYGGHPQFQRGLESRRLHSKAQRDKVVKVGGVAYPGYMEAEDAAERFMFPEGYDGIVPLAGGRFSAARIDRLRIYVPAHEAVAQ